jgi:acyl CoA:acetate/3-ketoacid CoA transferase alpha subunit
LTGAANQSSSIASTHLETLLNELSKDGPGNLTIASLTAGIDSYGLGKLYESGKVKRMIGSYVGENKVRPAAESISFKCATLNYFSAEFRAHVLHW